jgi:hypothetical protein
MVWPLLILIGSYCVPESPRYLLLSGKEDAARFVTLNQHTIHGEETFAKAEFLQMRRQAEMDKELDSTWLSFLKPHYRKRASIVIILAIIGQSSGNLVINNYVSAIPVTLISPLSSLTLVPGWNTLFISRI